MPAEERGEIFRPVGNNRVCVCWEGKWCWPWEMTLDFAPTNGVQVPPTSLSGAMSETLGTEKSTLCFKAQTGEACKRSYSSVGSKSKCVRSKLVREPDISV